jgi:hypothetical protein
MGFFPYKILIEVKLRAIKGIEKVFERNLVFPQQEHI